MIKQVHLMMNLKFTFEGSYLKINIYFHTSQSKQTFFPDTQNLKLAKSTDKKCKWNRSTVIISLKFGQA